MSLFSVFENLKLSEKFWRNLAPYISGYFLSFISIFFFFLIVVSLNVHLMQGFALFAYFPYWLRLICLDLIASSLLSIPSGVVIGYLISWATYGFFEYLRDNLMINCICCSEELYIKGIWIDGQTDIRCDKCGTLMAITIEEVRIKKLTLKELGVKCRQTN